MKQSHMYGSSPMKKYADVDIDPYSTAIVEDLLQGQTEWRSISDIVRLTFKALTDVVRAQGETIKEIEKQLPTRASKSELHTGLSLKANINDVSRTIAEVASSLDQKISFQDVQTVLKDHVLKSDLQYLLSNKVSIDEVRNILDRQGGVGQSELKTEMEILKTRVEEFQREVVKKVGSIPSLKDIAQISQALEMKANLQEVNEALETKASKQSVQSGLQKKVNKQEFEERLQQYATIQDVQSIVEALEQKASLDQIEKVAQILEVKVDRADFTILINSVQSKADAGDIDQVSNFQNEIKLQNDQRYAENLNKLENLRHDQEDLKSQLLSMMNKKVDTREFEKIQQNLFQKVGDQESNMNQIMRQEFYNDINRLRDEIMQQKQFMSEQMQSTVLKSSHLSEKLTEELYNLSEQVRQLDEDRRGDSEDQHKVIEDLRKIVAKLTNIKKEQTSKLETLYDEVDNVKKYLDDFHSKYVLKKDHMELKAKVFSNLDERQGDVQKAFNTSHQDFGSKLQSFKDEFRNEMKQLQTEMNAQIQKKITKLTTTISQDKSDNSIKQKMVVQQQDFEDMKKIVHKVCIDQDDKVTQKDFSQHIQFTKNVLDLIQKDMILRANIKDVCTLVDSKANIEDINLALTQIHKEVDNKSTYEDLNAIVKKQTALNELLSEENIIARFQWRSGELRSGSTVPWEFQIINTLPDNYIWEKDKSSILTVAPGVYQIQYGFYAKKKPNIQILVNGEAVITSFQSQQNVPTNQKIKEQHKHSSGNITGVTNIDFIVLPTRARVSVVYDGESGGEGFLGLKRL